MTSTHTHTRSHHLALVMIDYESHGDSPNDEEFAHALEEELQKFASVGIQHRVPSVTRLEWHPIDNAVDGDPRPEAENETAALVGHVFNRVLLAIGFQSLHHEGNDAAMLQAAGEFPGHVFLGGTAPNGTPISVQVNVTP